MEAPAIGVILLCYNSKKQLQTNWAALTDVSDPVRFVVIDNASTDGTPDLLRASGVPFHRNETNVGYSRAINQGLNILLDDPSIRWAVLVNPDIIPPPNYPSKIVSGLPSLEHVGIVGVRMVNPLKHVVHAGGMIGRPQLIFWPLSVNLGNGWEVVQREAVTTTRFRHCLQDTKEARQVPWVSFACAALNMAMLRDVGLLDDQFFLYGSDSKLAMVAARQGWQTWYNPNVTCIHDESANVRAAGSEIQLKAQADLRRFATIEGDYHSSFD